MSVVVGPKFRELVMVRVSSKLFPASSKNPIWSWLKLVSSKDGGRKLKEAIQEALVFVTKVVELLKDRDGNNEYTKAGDNPYRQMTDEQICGELLKEAKRRE